MVALQTGEIIALAGMVVLLLNKMGRRRVRTGKVPARGGLARMLPWGDYLALGLIAAGLVVIYIQK
jgi:hypothetical protein